MVKRIIFAILFISAFSSSTFAKDEDLEQVKYPREIGVYRNSYQAALNGGKHVPLEHVYELGELAEKAFEKENSPDLIERIVWDETDNYSSRMKLESKLAEFVPGYNIRQGASLFYYDVDNNSFLAIAINIGTAKDIKYFELHKKHFPGSESWPEYIEQITDDQGCKKYGSAAYLGFYKDWREFLDEYPNGFYSEKAREYLDEYFEFFSSCFGKEETIKALNKLKEMINEADKNKFNMELEELLKADKSFFDVLENGVN